ncbi:MAG: DoxX family protein [Tannerella sp.]|jgi:uncharacterized membrane protein YphA (DoxX/SURF4 family)/phosphoheptose isomerase|nr:DoxX family protein [Tannerella sp.]
MKLFITILRIAIGWHFLYEGLIKLVTPDWTSGDYLNSARGFLSGFFHWLAASPVRLEVVDVMNMAGLVLVGLSLFVGLLSRWSSLCGVFLLVLYYFAHPPFGISLLLDAHDGSVFVVDKLFVEMAALGLLAFCKEKGYGLDGLVRIGKKKTIVDAVVPPQEITLPETKTRREALKNLISLPVLGCLGWGAYRSNKAYGIDVMSGATVQINRVALSELKGELPKGKLGDHRISRLVMGGNLIGGWSHGRDLRYTDQLFKAYNTEKKIFDTLMLCEQAGINTINIGFPTIAVMAKYKKLTGSKINVITQIAISENSEDMFDNVTTAVDNGIDIIQLNGEWTDKLVRENRIHIIAGLMERIRRESCIAGLGAHDVNSLFACEEYGIVPDYFMKTMHHHNYWSVRNHSNTFHDNVFCLNPDRTIEFVNRTKVPVMGFKVLAAGAIEPKDGFHWAFENGADFICVGMFDFQVVDDINICIDTLRNLENRKREWFA